MTAGTRSAPGRITGWGGALPDKVITNVDLEATLETSDAWITERTGIKERRIGENTRDLAVEAGSRALARAGLGPTDVDVLLLCTSTPDRIMPATASSVQLALGANCGAFDLNAACSGFVYGLVSAYGLVATGARRVLLIGAETMSRIVDWTDRGTAILFGDGAGALVIEADDAPQLLGWDLGSDGAAEHILYTEHGGHIVMDGKEVFRRAVRVMVSSAEAALAAAGITTADVALLVPHQANTRIIDSACRRLEIGEDKLASNLASTGNTSAASIPLALSDAIDAGRVAHGDKVLMIGFGAGMSWASAVIEWRS